MVMSALLGHISAPLVSSAIGRARQSISARLWPRVLVLLATGAAPMIPALYSGIPSGPDLPNFFRTALPFYEALRHGEIVPRWLASSNWGYGDASFRVYPPAIYYLLAASRALAGNWYVATLAVVCLMSILGCLGVYFWASALTSRRGALCSAAFYAFAPFHVNEFYQAAMISEYAGAAWLAFAFGFAERLCRCSSNRPRDIAGFALFYSLLVLTHPPLAMMGTLALVVYFPIRAANERGMRALIDLGAAMALGLAASCWYWTRLAAEIEWVKGDAISPGLRFDYRANFLFSSMNARDFSTWWAGVLALMTLVMWGPSLVLLWRWTRKYQHRMAGVALQATFAFAVVMTTPLSRPLWAVIPRLHSIEFPWRWLGVASIVGAVALAHSVEPWMAILNGRRQIAIIAAGSVAIAIVFSIAHPMRSASFLSRPNLEALVSELPGSPSLPEWLPVRAEPSILDKGSPLVDARGRNVTISEWTAESRVFAVGPGTPGEARIHTFYYPLWSASAEAGRLVTQPAEDGSLEIALPAEAASVRLTFEEPVRARLAGFLSLICGIALGTIFVCSFITKPDSVPSPSARSPA